MARVTVDQDRCEGHARCMQVAPQIFEVRDDDRSYVLLDTVPEEFRTKVERAVRLCPRQAIAIKDQASTGGPP